MRLKNPQTAASEFQHDSFNSYERLISEYLNGFQFNLSLSIMNINCQLNLVMSQQHKTISKGSIHDQISLLVNEKNSKKCRILQNTFDECKFVNRSF